MDPSEPCRPTGEMFLFRFCSFCLLSSHLTPAHSSLSHGKHTIAMGRASLRKQHLMGLLETERGRAEDGEEPVEKPLA